MGVFKTYPAAHDPLAWPPLSWHSVLEKQVPFRLFGELMNFPNKYEKCTLFMGIIVFVFYSHPVIVSVDWQGSFWNWTMLNREKTAIFLKKRCLFSQIVCQNDINLSHVSGSFPSPPPLRPPS